jgi:hypothetical protein
VTTHPPTGDRITIWVAIPAANWNGRFLGVGGGGFSGGSAAGVNGPVALGYASGSTDTGHSGGNGSFALDENGRLDWQLIRDNAHVGIHEMTVTGKALTQAMYGVAPRYSYFNGCSTGGRQGLSEAQRYPQDYDGIVSGEGFMAKLAALLLPCAAFLLAQPQTSNIPHLERSGDVTQLIVDSQPFTILGGELYNNSATNLDYLKPIWPRLKAMNLKYRTGRCVLGTA